ncbi:GyrI-like domain-containing protein [Paenibacillus segetis]|nr:GyrI-like domain-containing protein [Paenibacillus segetis]
MKHEWKKHEKSLYLPKNKPELIIVPSFNFFTIEGSGNPNQESFSEAVGVLYSLSYGIKMSPKKGIIPNGYFEHSIYPLEGIWDISDEAKANNNHTLDKNELVYKIMIRQPDFVTKELACEIIETVKSKKPHPLLEKVQFEAIEDGLSVQILHTGPYDNEPESFELMDQYCSANGLVRTVLTHREIYITDARKTAIDKLKTVLRISVKHLEH